MLQLISTYNITILTAFCSIVYELLLAQTLSTIMGNTIMRYCITIGVYIAALGIGAMLCNTDKIKNPIHKLIKIELLLSFIGGFSVILLNIFEVFQKLFLINIELLNTDLIFDCSLITLTFYIFSHGVIILIGLLSGFEIPLLIYIGEKERHNSTKIILGMDYFGSLFGSVLFPLVLLPNLGIFGIGFLVGLINCLVVFILYFSKAPSQKVKYIVLCLLVFLIMIAGLVYADDLKDFYVYNMYFI